MKRLRHVIEKGGLLLVIFATVLPCSGAQQPVTSPGRQQIKNAGRGNVGSPYIPVDSWIYGAVLRLHDLGYLPTFYVGMRPYTRVSLVHSLRLSEVNIRKDEVLYGKRDEAVELCARLKQEFASEFAEETDTRIVRTHDCRY